MTSENRKLHISLAGAGTVGSAVIRLLRENADSIAANCGRRLEVCSIAVRDVARATHLALLDNAPGRSQFSF